MGPPPPPGEEKIVILKAVGGEIGSASALAPKLGPLGLVSSHLPTSTFYCESYLFCLPFLFSLFTPFFHILYRHYNYLYRMI